MNDFAWVAVFALIGALMALLVCIRARYVGHMLRLLDVPDRRRKLHRKVTPLVGGVAVVAPVGLVLLLLMPGGSHWPLLAAILFALGSAFVIGWIDDHRQLRATLRLVVSFLCAALALLAVPALKVTFLAFSFLDYAIFLEGWAWSFSLLCLVGLLNAVNMADGKNGLVAGLCLFWTLALAHYAPPEIWPLLSTLAAALCVVFAYNMKGRLFLGDSGAYALSFLIGVLTIYVYDVAFVELPADLVALFFLIPVVDCLRLMLVRIARGHSPFDGDRNHLHHMLAERMSWPRGLAIYLALVIVPALAAMLSPAFTLFWGGAALACYAVIVALPRPDPVLQRDPHSRA